MKLQNQNIKSNFLKKIFIKICRKLDFEIIDQANLHLPVMNKAINNNLSKIGKESLIFPMGRAKVTRPVKSLNIILRTCASVNICLLYTSPSPRDLSTSRMPSSA